MKKSKYSLDPEKAISNPREGEMRLFWFALQLLRKADALYLNEAKPAQLYGENPRNM